MEHQEMSYGETLKLAGMRKEGVRTRARAHTGENSRYSVTSPCLPRNQALQIRYTAVTNRAAGVTL